ncbi:MAG TPA: leucine-rich repeat protein [Perlabentimonas sp.]|nr:leucine-rich repeat protein [Perlabentimonas sp.]
MAKIYTLNRNSYRGVAKTRTPWAKLKAAKLLMLFAALLMLSPAMAQNLSVTITTADNATTQVTGQATLQAAIGATPLANVQKLEITAGTFNTADWEWLKSQKTNLTALSHFTISDGIGSVANIPDDFDGIAHFNNALQEVSVAKVAAIGILAFSNCTSLSTANFPQAISIGGGAFNECISLGTANFPQATSIGEQAFHACTYLTSTNFPQVTSIDLTAFALCSSLSTASFPQATSIGELAFAGCTSLSTLKLGATPPDVGADAFLNCPETRSLIWVDAEGNNLTGGALTNAGIAYKAVEDGDITDDLWYNWAFAQTLYRVTVNAENGHIVPSFAAAPSGTEVSLMVAPNVGYKLIDRTLEAHKTGDAATNVAITDGTFIMPEYDVTVTAQFELNTLNITINSTTNLSGNTLQNALGNADLSTITSLEVTGGGVFHTADWHWLKANRDKLSALTRFTISGGVGSVANIPSSFREPYFNTALQEVSVAKVERIGESTFQDCADLTTANFPQATSIGGYAFEHCSSLSTANFPQATSIGNYAFYNCTSLTTLSLGATPPWVGSYAFYGCPETRYLILADAEGNMLTGDALTTARNAYKNADDITDDLWEGWNFAETLYWITPGSARNGSLASSYAAAASQTEVRLTLTPNEGYKPKAGALAYHKTDDMATSVPISNDRFTMPAYNVTVTAQFEGLPQTLTLATAQNGSIISSPSTDIVTNTEITLSTLPQTGYHFKEGSFKAHKTSDESIPVAITNGTFTMPAYGVTATAEFEINTYDLTYTAGANGRLTGETNQTATHGSDGTTVTAVANTGYHFVKWSDGVETAKRTETSVIADKTVEAQFAINTYTLTYTADAAQGSITGNATQTVNHGAKGSEVEAIPTTGYHFVKWSDGSTANPRTEANVVADVTVEAEFAINTYTLTYTAGANGSLTGESVQTVNYGTNGTAVTAVPNDGYHFVKWSDESTANPRTDANVTADVTVVAEFAITTGVNDASINMLSLYPNPAKEQVWVKGLKEPVWVEVYSLTGAKVIAQLLQVDEPLDLNAIPNGAYIVRLEGKTFKLVVNK